MQGVIIAVSRGCQGVSARYPPAVVDVVKWVDPTVRRRNAKEALESDAPAQVVVPRSNATEEGAGVGMPDRRARAGIPAQRSPPLASKE